MSVYSYMCIYIYIYIHTWHTSMHAHAFETIEMHICTQMHAHVHVHTPVHTQHAVQLLAVDASMSNACSSATSSQNMRAVDMNAVPVLAVLMRA